MKSLLVAFVLTLVCQQSSGRAADEQSVVSVYTTDSSTAGTAPSLDVYHQIANNIAERIASPIYRFFGFNNTQEKTTKRPFERVELPSDTEKAKNVTDKAKPVTNDIDRDVEELSVDAVQKSDKKPEKFTLFSSYLPVKEKYENNQTSLELDDVDSIDDNSIGEDVSTPRGPLVFFLEFIASIIQLLNAVFGNLFNRPSSSNE